MTERSEVPERSEGKDEFIEIKVGNTKWTAKVLKKEGNQIVVRFLE